ncbi:GNAT family N-acetyltransferase [Metabacillus sp. RGM 3146]|uniref:GNAT family N-acetyltransferase n=1 Tax=Metabacillus sp. RGM 3146 TaxID=3401092 RepID=UPI003B9932DF
MQATGFPLLETNRLYLREITQEDKDRLFEIFSKEEVITFYGMEIMSQPADAEKLISKFKEGYASGTSIRWGITTRETGVLIGTIGFHNWSKIHCRAEAGYEIHPDYWRRGYASESLKAAIQYGYSSLNLHRIGATVRPENLASLMLLKNMGFEEEGILKDYQYSGGNFYDLMMLSIRNEREEIYHLTAL